MRYVEAYKDGEDNGWLHKQNFWFDPNHEHGFGIVNLDSIYPEKYFEKDHVHPETVEAYCTLIPKIFQDMTGKKADYIIEFGSAGGWFLKKFHDNGFLVNGIEGTKAGIDACLRRGIPKDRLWHIDLRSGAGMIYTKMYPNHRGDIVLCTEVAEHIETPFSANLVASLVQAGDFVWFSFEEPNTNPAHIHHPNEMPAKFWINLFDFYGFKAYKLPQWVYDQTEGRGMYIFYNPKTYDFSKFS